MTALEVTIIDLLWSVVQLMAIPLAVPSSVCPCVIEGESNVQFVLTDARP